MLGLALNPLASAPLMALTLADATLMLQMAIKKQDRLRLSHQPIGRALQQIPNLGRLGLTQETVATLQALEAGQVEDHKETLRSLALLTAAIGSNEVRDAGGELTQHHLVNPRTAIDQMLDRISHFERSPQPAFLAKMKDPTRGFAPFTTAQHGTEVAFYRTPDELGPPWAEMMRGHWQDGIGLVVYRNKRAGTYGMIFIHSLGKVHWSHLTEKREHVWQTSGGTMAFPHGRLYFTDALERTIDKGVAMTWKWRAVDEALRAADSPILTGLGGSKGLILHDPNDEGKETAMRIYAEVISTLGVTLTGSDEGVTPQWADFLAKLAPLNIYGSPHSVYQGRVPTHFTADGIFEGIKVILEEQFGDSVPVLGQGYGGIGSRLNRHFLDNNIPIAGIVERDHAKLGQARRAGISAPLYFDLDGRALSRREWWKRLTPRLLHRIRWREGLSEIVASTEGGRILSPNAGPHSLTFDVATSMILGGFQAAAGAANNQAGLDRTGSPNAIAWILQAAGIFHPADFVINRMGAMAVVSGAIGLDDADMARQVRLVGKSVREDYTAAFQQGIPPYLYQLRKAIDAWHRILENGMGIGGNVPSRSI